MKRLPLALALLVLLLAAAGCGGETGETGGDVGAQETATEAVTPPVETDDAPPETATGPEEVYCSATESGLSLPEQDLPEPVATLREELAEAASACDFETLGEIAARSEGFTYSSGGSEGAPADFWRRQEEQATGEPMYALLMVFSLPVTRNESGSYVWPSAHSPNATDADWQALVDGLFYTQTDIEQMRAAGTGYVGWRTAITAEGEWQYFTAGD